MNRVLAIGDIHGCLAQFDALLESISITTDDHLVLLGDYVDRGPNSAGVMKKILKVSQSHQVTALKGNHEEMMLAARTSHDKFFDWLKNGGDATLRSYAGIRGKLQDVPLEHWDFLEKNLVDHFETDTHIFAHAGAYPDMPIADQPDYILRWERFDRIAPHESGKIVVCGHTPQKSARPANKGFAICLDTHACGGGVLTCLDTGSGKLWQSDANRRVQRFHISNFSED